MTSFKDNFIDYFESTDGNSLDVLDDGVMIKSVVESLFYNYVTSDTREDRSEVVRLISRLDKRIKVHDDYWGLIGDRKEYNQIVEELKSAWADSSLGMQKNRHKGRNDYSYVYKDWLNAVDYFNGNCAYCGKDKKLTYDHFIPFSKGGAFNKGNIIPACATCNSSKNDNNFIDWYSSEVRYNEDRQIRVSEYINEHSL